jgi:hypothetical protein
VDNALKQQLEHLGVKSEDYKPGNRTEIYEAQIINAEEARRLHELDPGKYPQVFDSSKGHIASLYLPEEKKRLLQYRPVHMPIEIPPPSKSGERRVGIIPFAKPIP